METQTSYYNLEVGIEQAPLYGSLYISIDSELSCGMWEHSLCCTSEFINQRNARGVLLPLICGTSGQVTCSTCDAASCYQQGGQITQDSKLSLL